MGRLFDLSHPHSVRIPGVLLGRIVLPIELRRTLDIGEKDAVEIYVEGTSIVLKKYQPSCIFCGDSKKVVDFKGKNVCSKCLRELQNKQEQ